MHKSCLSHPLATFIFTCKSAKTEEEAHIVSGHTTAGKQKKRKKVWLSPETGGEGGGGVVALYSWVDA
jgi:hypothetical protein